MNFYEGQEAIEARNRDLAWGVRDRIHPATLHTLNARNFDVYGFVAPVLSMTVTLPPLTGGAPRDMRMEITWVEGVDLFDIYTVFYRDNGLYQGDAFGIGISNQNLDNFLMGLVRGTQRNANTAF